MIAWPRCADRENIEVRFRSCDAPVTFCGPVPLVLPVVEHRHEHDLGHRTPSIPCTYDVEEGHHVRVVVSMSLDGKSEPIERQVAEDRGTILATA